MGSPLYSTLTPKGRLSRRTGDKLTVNKAILLERLVRLDLARATGKALLTEDDIARALGRSKCHLSGLRNKTEYYKKRIQITTGISTEIAQSTEELVSRNKAYLMRMMPDAMRTFADILQSQASSIQEKNLKLKVALEVLDRQGSFPKISRTDVHATVEHNYNELDKVSEDILGSFDGPVQATSLDDSLKELIETNKAFSSSGSMSMTEQEKALAALESGTRLIN